MNKKSGFLIVLSLVFLILMISSVSAEGTFGDIGGIMGNAFNPLFRSLFGDAFDFAGENLWFFVIVYVAALSILVYVFLKRVKFFAEAPKLAKWLSFLLVVGFTTYSTGAAAGAFGPLPASVTPLIILFLLFKLGSGAAGAGLGRGYRETPRWEPSRPEGAGGMRRERAAAREEEEAAQKTTQDMQIDALIQRANAMTDEIAGKEEEIDKEEYELEEYEEKLGDYEKKYIEELNYLKNQLVALRYQNPSDPRIPQFEAALRAAEEKHESLLARLKEVIEKQKAGLEEEEAGEEKEEEVEREEEAEEKRELKGEAEVRRKEEKAGEELPEGPEKEKAEEAAEEEKREERLTKEEMVAGKKERGLAKKAEKEEKKAEEILDERLKAIDKLHSATKELIEGRATRGSALGQVCVRDINNALAILFPKKGKKPVLEKIEHIRKIHNKFKGLERTKEGIDKYKQRLRYHIREIEKEEAKVAGRIRRGAGVPRAA